MVPDGALTSGAHKCTQLRRASKVVISPTQLHRATQQGLPNSQILCPLCSGVGRECVAYLLNNCFCCDSVSHKVRCGKECSCRRDQRIMCPLYGQLSHRAGHLRQNDLQQVPACVCCLFAAALGDLRLLLVPIDGGAGRKFKVEAAPVGADPGACESLGLPWAHCETRVALCPSKSNTLHHSQRMRWRLLSRCRERSGTVHVLVGWMRLFQLAWSSSALHPRVGNGR